MEVDVRKVLDHHPLKAQSVPIGKRTPPNPICRNLSGVNKETRFGGWAGGNKFTRTFGGYIRSAQADVQPARKRRAFKSRFPTFPTWRAAVERKEALI